MITDMRRCRKCKEHKKLDGNHFQKRKRDRRDGTRVVVYEYDCLNCTRKAARERKTNYEYTNGRHGKQKPIPHPGPQGIDKLFFCQLTPTPLGGILRKLRREALTL